jgi:hypothetical protein
MARTSLEALERRIDELRAAVRKATIARDAAEATRLRAQLREAERAWDEALAKFEDVSAAGTSTPLLPLREQVHHALTLLTVPAAPRMIVAVHHAFFSGEMIPARLTSLRRDEERSWSTARNSRPYYLVPALDHERFAPARGLLAVSTWPMAQRIVGPLSPRVHFLTSAIKVAEHVERLTDPGAAATRLLWRFAANIPGAAETPQQIARAAREELTIHQDADLELRETAAKRALRQLKDPDLLFGSRIAVVSKTRKRA